ncbi:MAG: DEAD/DEAH box helicase, partial [bacterium]
MTFEELGLHPDLLKGIHDLGFARPTPVQEEAIPHILEGRDVIACAQTGTGKTAAFVLPILHRLLSAPKQRGPRALILAPTRELAQQSMDQLTALSRYVPLRGAAGYGGVSMAPQIKALSQGVELLSATPGRLLDHAASRRVVFTHVDTFVLDEADRMLDMGFLPDIRRIVALLPPKRQNVIMSATIPDEIMGLVKQMCHDPVTIQIGLKSRPPVGIRHAVYPVSHEQKIELLMRLLNGMGEVSSVIIFVRTKERADRLA